MTKIYTINKKLNGKIFECVNLTNAPVYSRVGKISLSSVCCVFASVSLVSFDNISQPFYLRSHIARSGLAQGLKSVPFEAANLSLWLIKLSTEKR